MGNRTRWLTMGALGIAVAMTFAAVNQAQSPAKATANSQVAVVNLVKVFNDFEQTKALNQLMFEHRNKIKEEADTKGENISVEEEALNKFAPDSADYHTRSQKLRELKFNFEVWKMMAQDQVASEHLAWMQRTYDKVVEETAKLAKSKGIALVITQEDIDTDVKDSTVLMKQILNRKVVFADSNIDITNELLANLNAAFEKAGGVKNLKFSQ